MRVLKIFLLVVMLLLPLGELLRFNLGNNVYLKPLDLMVGVTAISYFIYLYIQKELVKFKTYYYIFPLIGLVSLLIHAPSLDGKELLVSGLYLVRFILYLSLVFVVASFSQSFKETIWRLLFYAGLAFVIFGILQYFFFNDLRYFIFLGWDDHLYRLFSTFFDPNFAGAFLVLYFLFVGGIYFSQEVNKLKIPRIVLTMLLATTLLAIFLTYSRSALIMLVISSIVLLSMIQKKRLLFVLGGVILIFVAVISPFFYLENVNLFRTVSSQSRIVSSQNAITIFQVHPLLGVGFNTYRYTQQEYGFRSENPKYPSNADAGVDNSWLFVLVTTGIIGFGAYCYFWFSLLKNAFAQKKSMLAKVFIASAAGLFVNALFINSLFFAPIMLWMWILYGLIKKE